MFPPAYVCVGRRALIHKQCARGFVCSRQGLQAVPRAPGPSCVSKEAAWALWQALPLFHSQCMQESSQPTLCSCSGLTAFSKCAGLHAIPRPAQHPKASTASQDHCQIKPGASELPEEHSWEGLSWCNKWGPFPPGVRVSALSTETCEM